MAPSPHTHGAMNNPPTFRNLVWRRDAAHAAREPCAEKPLELDAPARVLVDLFAGKHAPISAAASQMGIPHWAPIDIAIDEAHDILSDAFFTRLLRLAPPCRDYSVLKLAPGGPPPCRTPEHLNGLPSNSPVLARQAEESRRIHERCHQLCRAVASSGGTWGLENPPSSMAWLEPSCQQLLRASAAHVASVAACGFGVTWSKSWAFASNSPHIRGVQHNCAHAFKHPSLRNKRDTSGGYISSSTAEYPAALACSLLQALPQHMAGPGPRAPACDGAGLQSTADSSMTATPQACLAPLIEKMQAWCMQDDRYKRIAAHIAQSKPEHPLSEEEQGSLLQMAAASLNLPPQSASAIEEGQPFRLGLLSHLARITQDIDKHLPSVLAQGVPASSSPLSAATNGLPLTPNRPNTHWTLASKSLTPIGRTPRPSLTSSSA